MDLNTSSNGIKVSFIQICFRSLLSLIQETSLLSECICEAMLDSFVNLPDKTFRFDRAIRSGTISSDNSEYGNFAVGYKYTKSSRRGKNFPQEFFIISIAQR